MKVESSLLDYYKLILDKVSFDHQLLAKEYRKAIRTLQEQERQHLDQWLAASGLSSRIANSLPSKPLGPINQAALQ